MPWYLSSSQSPPPPPFKGCFLCLAFLGFSWANSCGYLRVIVTEERALVPIWSYTAVTFEEEPLSGLEAWCKGNLWYTYTLCSWRSYISLPWATGYCQQILPEVIRLLQIWWAYHLESPYFSLVSGWKWYSACPIGTQTASYISTSLWNLRTLPPVVVHSAI